MTDFARPEMDADQTRRYQGASRWGVTLEKGEKVGDERVPSDSR